MIYRTEHPKPQFMRENWLNLNGSWDFEIDHGGSGEARELTSRKQTFQKKYRCLFARKVSCPGLATRIS